MRRLVAALALLTLLGAAGAATHIVTTPALADPQCTGC